MKRASSVVAIVVFLTCGGLLIWWTSRARQAAMLTECTNNLRQTALALDNHHETYKQYPVAVTPNSRTKNDVPLDQRFSWIFDVSHYMDARMDPKWRIDPNKPYDAPENRHVYESYAFAALCPANPDKGEPKLQWTHYVAIAGIGRDAILLEEGERSGFMGFTRIITKSSIKDGLAHTTTVVETARDNGHWAKAGWTTARGLDSENAPYLGKTGQFNSRHNGFSANYLTNAAFADCSVRPLTSRLEPHVFEALATIAGGERADPDIFR